MADARARHIADLLLVHAEDLAFLWGQRREALTSRRHTLREFNELNERIEAHLQGLLIAGSGALMELMQPQLASPDRDDAFAAAYALLRANHAEATQAVMIEFSRAADSTLGGLRDALSSVPLATSADNMRAALEHAKPDTAVAAAVVLANHRVLDAQSSRLAQLLEDNDPIVCALAWRAAAAADTGAPQFAAARPYRHSLTRAPPPVRHACWAAVAAAGRIQAMPLLRHTAAEGDTVALRWLAVLGDESDAASLQQSALAMNDVVAACDLLSRHGHPSALGKLLDWMEGEAPEAAAAGAAFTRLTGIDIRGQRVTLPVPDDADDFTREMAPDIWLPNTDQARIVMQRRGGEWAQATRWCQGFRVDGEVGRELLLQLDLEARWEVAARAAMNGRPVSGPAPVY
jgi:uncharacterized protein (TIGR02270 family)